MLKEPGGGAPMLSRLCRLTSLVPKHTYPISAEGANRGHCQKGDALRRSIERRRGGSEILPVVTLSVWVPSPNPPGLSLFDSAKYTRILARRTQRSYLPYFHCVSRENCPIFEEMYVSGASSNCRFTQLRRSGLRTQAKIGLCSNAVPPVRRGGAENQKMSSERSWNVLWNQLHGPHAEVRPLSIATWRLQHRAPRSSHPGRGALANQNTYTYEAGMPPVINEGLRTRRAGLRALSCRRVAMILRVAAQDLLPSFPRLLARFAIRVAGVGDSGVDARVRPACRLHFGAIEWYVVRAQADSVNPG